MLKKDLLSVGQRPGRHLDGGADNDDRAGGLVCQYLLHCSGRNIPGCDHARAGPSRRRSPYASRARTGRRRKPRDFDWMKSSTLSRLGPTINSC
jgi:hypothetical protein